MSGKRGASFQAWLTLGLFGVALFPCQRLEAQASGSIEGSVALAPAPQPRAANRYAGGASQSQQVQPLRAVVFLAGPVDPDARPTVPASMAQRDTTFVPAVVAIQAGETVSFPNEDPFQHHVSSYSSAGRFDTGRQDPGTSDTERFDQPGVVEIFCEVHDFMRGAIVVTESPFHAVVDEDGSFTIEGVPAGEHTLVFWHADHRPHEQTVVVPSGGIASVGEIELQR